MKFKTVSLSNLGSLETVSFLVRLSMNRLFNQLPSFPQSLFVLLTRYVVPHTPSMLRFLPTQSRVVLTFRWSCQQFEKNFSCDLGELIAPDIMQKPSWRKVINIVEGVMSSIFEIINNTLFFVHHRETSQWTLTNLWLHYGTSASKIGRISAEKELPCPYKYSYR